MSCPDHTVKVTAVLDGTDVELKLDTRRVEVTSTRGPVHGALDQSRLAAGDTLVVRDRRTGATVAYEVSAAGASRHRPVPVSVVSGGVAEHLELLASTSVPRTSSHARWRSHPLFSTAVGAMRSTVPQLTEDAAAALLAVGVGPRTLAAYGRAGASSVDEVRRLHRSRVTADQLQSWRILDQGMEVRAMQRAQRVGLTPERIAGYAGVLADREFAPTPAGIAEMVDATGATTGARWAGQFPLEYLWGGPAPVARFLHDIGVSPRMLERGIEAESALEGQGAYFSKLAGAVRGRPDSVVQLLDYTLLQYRSGPGEDTPLAVDDRALVRRALDGVRSGMPVRRAVRAAVHATLEAHDGEAVATAGVALVNAVAVSVFTNSQPAAAALWADQVRQGSGTLRSGRDRAWQDVKNVVQDALREGSCPKMAGATGAKGLVAFYAAGPGGLSGMSAAERQQVRHGYLLHPDGHCTAACGQVGRDQGLSVVLEGAQRELLLPLGAQAPAAAKDFVCRHCHLRKALSLRWSADDTVCLDCA